MKKTGHSISGAFVFFLLGIFAVLSTVLVLFGAQGYKTAVEKSTAHNRARIQHAILMGAVRSGEGVAAVREMDGRTVLTFTEDIDGEKFVKYLFCADGSLCELFTEEERGFDVEEGQVLCEAQELRAQISDGLLTAAIVNADGQMVEAAAALKTN